MANLFKRSIIVDEWFADESLRDEMLCTASPGNGLFRSYNRLETKINRFAIMCSESLRWWVNDSLRDGLL